MLLSDENLPVRAIKTVWHVGSMRKTDKVRGSVSHEGAGLSVSCHPAQWTRIARLSGECYRLDNNRGQFLDYHQLSSPQREVLCGWAAKTGLLNRAECFEVEYRDTEAQELFVLRFAQEAQAREELKFYLEVSETAKLTKAVAWCSTKALDARMGFKVDPLLAEGLAATCWVEDCTELAGVWWADVLDLARLSAPRGVILPSRLKEWTVRKDKTAI